MLAYIDGRFQIPGDFAGGEPYGSGHINDTYLANYIQGEKTVRYIHQRINDNVFKEPLKLMENVARVTRHQLKKLKESGDNDPSRHCLQLVPAVDEKPFFIDEKGKFWRTWRFIENARSHDIVETRGQAREAAAAFGRFQKSLVDLPGERLHEIIPDFHHTEKRFAALERAIASDPLGRASHCTREIDFARQRAPMTSLLVDLTRDGRLPERITHNDTKVNNVLLDDRTQEAVCVIDLDTVMPGSVLYDFGDLVRTSANSAGEDERDLDKVFIRMEVFEALVEGYLGEADEFLTPVEREGLPLGAKLMTFENGIRFLADYLEGDIYYKISRETQNLDRCRVQFKLVESIERNEARMNRVIEKHPLPESSSLSRVKT
ncbi:MAG: aminoglycoside phosphotransferase family protein [Desulfobacterales bacterium]|nr:aminoglycoside phosphotransferase family protein [Desulfobacterales bacterium]